MVKISEEHAETLLLRARVNVLERVAWIGLKGAIAMGSTDVQRFLREQMADVREVIADDSKLSSAERNFLAGATDDAFGRLLKDIAAQVTT